MTTTQLDEIKQKAAELGVKEWADKVEEWHNAVVGGDDIKYPSRWYLTDIRHTHNLASAQWQGYLRKWDHSLNQYVPVRGEREDAILELEDMIFDYVEDHFQGEGDEA